MQRTYPADVLVNDRTLLDSGGGDNPPMPHPSCLCVESLASFALQPAPDAERILSYPVMDAVVVSGSDSNGSGDRDGEGASVDATTPTTATDTATANAPL